MKKTIYSLTFALMLTFSTSIFAQDPPPPPGDPTITGNNVGSNDGGGIAPIDGGISFLLLLGVGYVYKKAYQLKKENKQSL